MLWHCLLLSTYLILTRLCSTSAVCPSTCYCKQNEKGKRKVYCPNGGMKGPVPVAEMDQGMEILEITAPEGNWNKLTITPIFQKFKHLEEVHVTRSGVLQIGMHAFWGVPTLEILNFKYNNISVVSDHNFRGLLNLVELNLDYNLIKSLPSAVFKHTTELRILTLQGNKLKELVPRVFFKLHKLQVLKLSDNDLEELNPDVFKDILELKVLECRNCGLQRINTQIYHLLPYLTHLDLGNNKIQFVAADEFVDLRKIVSLHFDGNLLPVVLERSFVNQRHLKYLCLARNRIAKITNTAFVNLTSLVELDISYNRLYKFEHVIMEPIAESLQKFHLSGNYRLNLGLVKTALEAAYSVKELSLANMKLTEIPQGYLPNRIEYLNLSSNNLTELTARALPKKLVELDISRNKLQMLDEGVLIRIKRLKLHSNPWACDNCHLKPILPFMNKSNAIQDIICASPVSVRGRPLHTLNIKDIPVCYTKNSSFLKEYTVIIIVILCLAVFLSVFISILLYSYARKRPRRNRVTKEQHKIVRESDVVLENATTIFGSSEITFKFPLDLTEQRVSVSTIGDMKKDTQLHILPNGTGI